MEEDSKLIFNAALKGEKIKDIATEYHLSEADILKKFKTLEDEKHPNYNPNLAYKIMMNRNIINS